MKKASPLMLCMLFMLNHLYSGQVPDFPPDSKPAPTNVPGVEFLRIDSQLRAIFRVEAPNARKVQLDLGSKYDMVKGDDGAWTITFTTNHKELHMNGLPGDVAFTNLHRFFLRIEK